MSVDWLIFLANGVGFLGSAFLLVPFFREDRLKQLISDLGKAPAGSGGAAEVYRKAHKKVEAHLGAWKPSDYRWMVGGVFLLGLSYLINIVIWFLSKPPPALPQ